MTRMPRKDPQIMELIERHGPNPQLVGIVDGTEDDFGDLLIDVADHLEVDTEDDIQWQHFQEVALECRETTMETWVGYIKERMKTA